MRPDYFTVDELTAVCLARTIKDGDLVFNGVASALPFTAMALAKQTHARNSVFLGGLQGAVNPVFPFLPPISVDYTFSQQAELMIPVDEIFNAANSGKLNRIFFGGGQIDKFGNANNTVIGDIAAPKVKLPGGAGAFSLSCNANHFTLWNTKHFISEAARKQNNLTFVEQVDFVTTVGHVTPDGSRQELGLRGGGPDWVVTDLGVFDFDPNTKVMRLKSIHPCTTFETIQDCTGFALVYDAAVQVTPPPMREEVELIRAIDPLNIRKRLFSEEQLDVRMEFAD